MTTTPRGNGPGTTRQRRSKIHGDRKRVMLRMGEHLNARLMTLCDEIESPANTYITWLLVAALELADPSDAAKVEGASVRGEPKVNFTLRLSPGLHDDISAVCSAAGLSLNDYICCVIHRDLTLRGRGQGGDGG